MVICVLHIPEPKSTPKKRAEASITLSELNDLLLLVPSFVPNFTAVQDPLCQQHGKIFLRQLRGYKLWALQSEFIFLHPRLVFPIYVYFFYVLIRITGDIG